HAAEVIGLQIPGGNKDRNDNHPNTDIESQHCTSDFNRGNDEGAATMDSRFRGNDKEGGNDGMRLWRGGYSQRLRRL
ncbi:MAG: hypothetical protein ACR2P4_05695, partial [Gammaproteobacteria bacterium]